MTEEEVKAQFLAELNQLLEKWSTPDWEASIFIKENQWGQSSMCAEIPSVWSKETLEVFRPTTYVDLGSEIQC